MTVPIKQTDAPAGTTGPDGVRATAQIIVVNWNSGDYLRRCIGSIAEFGAAVTDRVVVVDNGSVDGSADIAGDGMDLEIRRTGANLGFGRACNLGAEGATAPYLLFLNPDAALHAGTLQGAIAYLESADGADAAVCGVRLIGDDGQVQHHTTSLPTARTIFTHAQLRTHFDHLTSRDVDHVIGAFYLIRRPVFESLGGFDERFFVYLEDVDLSLRVHRAGWKIHYLASAVGFHRGGGTSENVKATRLFYAMRSRLFYATKHFRWYEVAMIVGVTFLVEPLLRLARALAHRSRLQFADTLRAYFMLARDMPRILRTAGAAPDIRAATDCGRDAAPESASSNRSC